MSNNNLIEIVDYSPWAEMEVFSLYEASYLIAGYEPRLNVKKHPTQIEKIAQGILEVRIDRRDDGIPQTFENEVCDILIGDIKTYLSMSGTRSKFLERRKNLGSGVNLKEITEIKDELKQTREQLKTLTLEIQNLKFQAQGRYMNPDHPLFAPELETAVAVWTALFSESTEIKERGKTSKKLIAGWVQENRTNFSKEAVERIKTLANPENQKKGGAPKTEI